MKNPAKPHFQVFKKVKYRKQYKPKNGCLFSVHYKRNSERKKTIVYKIVNE
ncbi:hypothetical protein LEP1GSC036_0915 [Leptospira weilii str. 2006001853]|uniref:Uncharacterized protein n=1 Tax=Leptospira weilii str. 2006001853 TaxID=1001589 RepID=A0A828YXV5_9LEPT|nr:hypothetical protein LEP1GSC036_0915 [Leptospira weilii str. 2006001853]EMN45236.1 hypothetical protein LEP1GSC086_3680 [Leptospira weilii str. LNT 1234]